MKKKIAIMGSTGSIGTQALDVVRSYPEEFEITALICRNNSEAFRDQVKEFRPSKAVVVNEMGEDEVISAVTLPGVDLVVISTVGLSGLKPTLAAIKAKKDVALATKEAMVLAGSLVIEEVVKNKINLLPIDSELAALRQCLRRSPDNSIKRLILTMGKGNLAKMTKKELERITVDEVLDRKVWKMGEKISVDSATGMNKAFEVIEASKWFGINQDKIELVVHPEYLCHSLVEFVDGSILTELGTPDMRRYIHQALFYPQRKTIKVSKYLDLIDKQLSFEEVPFNKFPLLKYGHLALNLGGTVPAVIHGADESAVDLFIRGEIKFTEIKYFIDKAINNHKVIDNPTLNQIIEAHEEGRRIR